MRLTDFPLEVIVELLVQADFAWRDLLNIRQTCKILHDASKARAVWANLIIGYLSPSTNTPIRLVLERSLKHYSSKEMEGLILQFHRAQIRLDWRQKEVTPMIYDTTFPPPDRRSFGKGRILPGGRWLLGIMPMYRLCYFDLDAADVEPVALTPPVHRVKQDRRPVDRILSWNIDQDKSFEVLTYNVSMVFGFQKDDVSYWRQDENRVDIWRIQLSIDQNLSKSASSWKSEKVATFPLDQRFIDPKSISIFRRHFTYTFTYQEENFLALVDWNQPSDGSLNYTRQHMILDEDLQLDFSPMYIQLLPNEYVFTAINHEISLISLKDSPKETGPPTSETKFGKPIWQTVSLDLSNYQVSGPFFCVGSTRFIITGRAVIYGLRVIIPNTRPKKRKFVFLAKLPFVAHVNSFLSTLGYNRTIANGQGPGSMQLFNFTWPDETETQAQQNAPVASCVGFRLSNQPDDYPVPKFITMDEQSGRMVTRDPMQSSNIDVYSVA